MSPKYQVGLNDYNVIRAMGDALGSLEKTQWEDSEPLVRGEERINSIL